MSDFVFDVSKVEKNYSEKSFARSRPEPRSDVFFEFRVDSATLSQARINEEKGTGGYLQLNLKVSALDGEGNAMFTKFVNISHPTIYQGHSPHDAAVSIFAANVSALHKEWYAYDTVQQHPSNPKKRIYTHEGVEVSKDAFVASEKARTAAVGALADDLISPNENTRKEALEGLVGRTFFAKVQPDKTGQYVNVRPMIAIVTEGEKVCYDAQEAYGD